MECTTHCEIVGGGGQYYLLGTISNWKPQEQCLLGVGIIVCDLMLKKLPPMWWGKENHKSAICVCVNSLKATVCVTYCVVCDYNVIDCHVELKWLWDCVASEYLLYS